MVSTLIKLKMMEFRLERVLMATRVIDGIHVSSDYTIEMAKKVIDEERKAEYKGYW